MTKKDQQIAAFKIICLLFYLILASLTIASICCYWRNAHYQDEEYIINGQKVTFEYKDAIMSFGIIRNCKISDKDDCELPVGTGFVSDTTILVMQSIILGIYVFNIVVILISCNCQTNDTNILCITIFMSSFPFWLNLFCLSSFSRYYDQYYYPYSKAEFAKLGNASKFYRVENNAIIGQYIYKITYSHGYKTAFASFIIGIIAHLTSIIVAIIFIEKEEKAKIVKVEADLHQ